MYSSGSAALDKESVRLTNQIFASIDKNKDGKLSLGEFVDGAQSDRTLISMLEGKPLI